MFAQITFAFSRETFFSLLAKCLRFPPKIVFACKSYWMQSFKGQCKTFAHKEKVSWESAKLFQMYAKILKGIKFSLQGETQSLMQTNTHHFSWDIKTLKYSFFFHFIFSHHHISSGASHNLEWLHYIFLKKVTVHNAHSLNILRFESDILSVFREKRLKVLVLPSAKTLSSQVIYTVSAWQPLMILIYVKSSVKILKI